MTIPKAWSVCKIRDIREVLQLPNLSLQFFVRTYPRETQEMVFDAHDRAFAFFKVACTRGIYDNMKTAGETIFAGKDRCRVALNRALLHFV